MDRPSQARRLALGTVQFGLDYGISNTAGITSESEIGRILALAAAAGIDTLDTAPAYGVAEARLGAQPLAGKFRVVTKVPGVPGEEIDQAGLDACRASVEASLRALRRDCIDLLLMHSPADLAKPGIERLAELLVRLREEGLVGGVGASVYTPGELALARRYLPLDAVQLPANILDNRFASGGHIEGLAATGCEVHVRSAFLQGLLLMAPEAVPIRFGPVADCLRRIDGEATHRLVTRMTLLLDHLLSQPGIARIVVGVNDLGQLEEILAALVDVPLGVDASQFHIGDERILNPARWPTL